MQQSVNIGMKGTQQFPAQMKGHIPRKQKKNTGHGSNNPKTV